MRWLRANLHPSRPNLGLEAEHLLAILAELAVHQVLLFTEQFAYAFGEGIQHQRVVVQIRRFDEFDVMLEKVYVPLMEYSLVI